MINALYEGDKSADNRHVYSGEKYICLRDEFITAQPKAFSADVREVLALFGGTDPSNLTEVVYRLAREAHKAFPHIHFTFIAGLGYDCEAAASSPVRKRTFHGGLRGRKIVSAYMKKADLAFTSQGRTVYEFASLGVPAIVLAQNRREQLHTFAQMENGFFNLGLGSEVSFDTLRRSFDFLGQHPAASRGDAAADART